MAMQSARSIPTMKRRRPAIAATLPPSTPPSPKQSPTTTTYCPVKHHHHLSSTTTTRRSIFNSSTTNWAPLHIPKSELNLPLTFSTGKTFCWKQTAPLQFTGVVGGSHLVSLKHLPNGDVCYLFHHTGNEHEARSALLDFLNMGISLSELWDEFKACDPTFADLALHFEGVRVLTQDPLECLVQFICSSNNNIVRITKMVDFISSLGEYSGSLVGLIFISSPRWIGWLWLLNQSLERLDLVTGWVQTWSFVDHIVCECMKMFILICMDYVTLIDGY